MVEPGSGAELRTGEIREKIGLLRRRRTYSIALTAEDFEAFQPLFDQVTTELVQWRHKRGHKTGAVRLHATIHPWIAGRVRDYVKRLRRSDSHSFLQAIPLYMELTALDGETIDTQVLEPGTEAPAKGD